MRTLIWFAYFWISLICLTPSMLYTILLDRKGRRVERDRIVSKCVYGWMNALLRLAGVTVQVDGLEQIPEDKPCVFVCNHQGNFDIPILLCFLDRPHGIVAKKELGRLPFIRIWMRYLGCVFLDRHNARQSAQALGQAVENLQNGYSMIIFPEGTRSRGKPVGEFKAGAFRIAAKTGAYLVPVCIEGSYRAMEAQGFWIRPAKVSLTLMPPIDTATLSKEQMKELPAQLEQMIGERREQIFRGQAAGA